MQLLHKNFFHKIFITKKIYKRKFTISSIKKIFVHSINMPNLQQNNEIKHINKEVNLLQDLLKKNEKSLNQFKKWVNANWMNTSKKRKKYGSFSNQKNTKYT